MNRASFLRSLFIVSASPKIIAELKPSAPEVVTNPLFSQLPLLTPSYFKDYVMKYGNEDFTWWFNEIGKYPLDKKHLSYAEAYLVEEPTVEEPIIITLSKENFSHI